MRRPPILPVPSHLEGYAGRPVIGAKVRTIQSREGGRQRSVRPELFREAAERQLHDAALRVAAKAGEHKRAGHYREALEAIAGLRPVVDRFFDDVLVMAEEEDLRRNRLTLLEGLLREFSTIADFSEIVVEETK